MIWGKQEWTLKSSWVWGGLIFLDCKFILLRKVWLVRLGFLLEHLCLVEKTDRRGLRAPAIATSGAASESRALPEHSVHL